MHARAPQPPATPAFESPVAHSAACSAASGAFMLKYAWQALPMRWHAPTVLGGLRLSSDTRDAALLAERSGKALAKDSVFPCCRR